MSSESQHTWEAYVHRVRFGAMVLTWVCLGTHEHIAFPLSPVGGFPPAPCSPLTLPEKPEWTEDPLYKGLEEELFVGWEFFWDLDSLLGLVLYAIDLFMFLFFFLRLFIDF